MSTVRLLVVCALVSACSSPPSASSPPPMSTADSRQVPSYMSGRKSCALLIGGSIGNALPDPQIAAYWHDINREIADQLSTRLSAEGYRTTMLVVTPAENGAVRRLTLESLRRHRCDRTINVANVVDEDTRGKFFRVDVSAYHLEQRGDRQPDDPGIQVTSNLDYQRQYRFARDAATFESFRIPNFTEVVFKDLKASGVIDVLR